MKNDETINKRCPIHFAMNMFGDKWSLLIIRDIMFFGKRYYNEFLNSNERISTNILANRLTCLEEKGIIYKEDKESKKSRYLLTQKGLDLMPVLFSITQWAGKHDENCIVPQSMLEQFKENPKGFEQEMLDKYQQDLGVDLSQLKV